MNSLLYRLRWHRPLFQRALHAGAQLTFIEGFPSTVALHDARQHQLGGLKSRKALPACRALAATAHHVALTSKSRINDSRILCLTKPAAHRPRSRLLVNREALAKRPHFLTNPLDNILIFDVIQHIADPMRQLPHFVLFKASRRHGWCTDT